MMRGEKFMFGETRSDATTGEPLNANPAEVPSGSCLT